VTRVGGLALILPELLLLASALVALFADVLFRGSPRAGAWAGAVGAALAALAAWWAGQGSVPLFGGMFAVDGASQVARIVTGVLTAAFLVWLAGAGLRRGDVRTFTALVLFSALGAMLMTAARDWVVLLLALEVATMPAYVLMGFDRRDDRGLEGALKYFLLSMVASALFLYGLSFVIGMSGATAMSATRLEPGVIGAVAAAFLVAGLLAKLSAAPFQWWAPDAYAGAPAAAVAFVSAVPKVAGLVAFARVVEVLAPQTAALRPLLIGAAVLSMVVGNLAAYPQQDLRRLMAYSGVAHAGYLLVGLAAGNAAGLRAALFYAIAYAVPSMGVMLVVAETGDRLDDLRGLAARRPWAAWVTALMLLSLVGVPPLAGFIGKLYLFTAAMGAGLAPLAVLGLAMSAVSAGFYFRIVSAMFFDTPVATAPVLAKSRLSAWVVVLCALAVVAIGIASGPLLSAISFAAP
jgi:NADH-quinone oxidoreductase subunit N